MMLATLATHAALALSLFAAPAAPVAAPSSPVVTTSDYRVGPRLFRSEGAGVGYTLGMARARQRDGYQVVTDFDLALGDMPEANGSGRFSSFAVTRGLRREHTISDALTGRIEAGAGAFLASGRGGDVGSCAAYVSAAVVYRAHVDSTVGLVAETRLSAQPGNHEYGGQSSTLGLSRRF